MSRHLYTTLIEGFCKQFGLDDPSAIMHGATVETDGIRFSLLHLENANPSLLFIYCDFGDPPGRNAIEEYRALLTKNLFFYSGDGPTFAISPDTGRIVLAQYERLAELQPRTLADKLMVLAGKVSEWRNELFLTETEKKPSQQLYRRA